MSRWQVTRAISVLAMLSILGNTRLSAQVIGSDLLVGSLYTNPSLDRYSGTTGAYLGPFGTGSSLVGFRYFTYGPDGNLYATPYDMNFGPRPVLKFDGHTGALISTFVSADGFSLTFGPDGNLYRLERGTNVDRTVIKYNGVTGALIGTFVAGGVNQLSAFSTQLRFGPNGNLFVADGQKIQQFDGQTGAFLGQFTPSPSGGLTNAFDFIFGPNNKLLVAGENNIGNDRIL